MHPHDYDPAQEMGHPPFARHWHGPHGPHMHGWEERPRFGGWGGPGFGARRWGWGRPPFGGPRHFRHFRHGPRHFGPPWVWGDWRPDAEREQRWAKMRTLRPAIGGLIALIRAAEPAHVEAIEGVLADARRRIAAILAESRPATPPTQPTSGDGSTML